MYTSLLTELKNGIFTMTINRADKLNALNQSVIDDLDAAMDEIYQNPEIRSAILTGAGSKAFVAGADISEFLALDKNQGAALSKKGQDVFFRIENAPKPVIAAVNGFALGGGCELSMACHFRICSENAKFGQPEVNLGLIPGYGGTQRLAQLVGKGRAMELLLSGKLIDAATALRYGLVNEVVPQEGLLNLAHSILENINSKAPKAVSYCIQGINFAFAGARPKVYDWESEMFGACCGTEDMKEGVRAFLEKRKPVFKGN
jgi:enoyl-CoA hydratase